MSKRPTSSYPDSQRSLMPGSQKNREALQIIIGQYVRDLILGACFVWKRHALWAMIGWYVTRIASCRLSPNLIYLQPRRRWLFRNIWMAQFTWSTEAESLSSHNSCSDQPPPKHPSPRPAHPNPEKHMFPLLIILGGGSTLRTSQRQK